MSPQSSRLSRRSFVENSALAFGMLGAAGLAPSNSYAADAVEASSLAATSRVNARQSGAKGDGKADDSKALQAALDAAQTAGPICFVPGGIYRLDGPLVRQADADAFCRRYGLKFDSPPKSDLREQYWWRSTFLQGWTFFGHERQRHFTLCMRLPPAPATRQSATRPASGAAK